MNTLCLAAYTLPQNLTKNIAYGMLVVIAVTAVFCIIKCIQGADMLDRGEDGKKKIYSGIAIGMAPWIAMAAFQATGMWEAFGIKLDDLKSIGTLPPNFIDATQLALWVVIGTALIWCVAKCVQGADMLDRGADGKKKIYSGIAIAAAPWIAIGALNVTGLWDGLGLKLL